jgi:hypothetical protein
MRRLLILHECEVVPPNEPCPRHGAQPRLIIRDSDDSGPTESDAP